MRFSTNESNMLGMGSYWRLPDWGDVSPSNSLVELAIKPTSHHQMLYKEQKTHASIYSFLCKQIKHPMEIEEIEIYCN